MLKSHFLNQYTVLKDPYVGFSSLLSWTPLNQMISKVSSGSKSVIFSQAYSSPSVPSTGIDLTPSSQPDFLGTTLPQLPHSLHSPSGPFPHPNPPISMAWYDLSGGCGTGWKELRSFALSPFSVCLRQQVLMLLQLLAVPGWERENCSWLYLLKFPVGGVWSSGVRSRAHGSILVLSLTHFISSEKSLKSYQPRVKWWLELSF